jgi:hypothetical protein
MNTPWSWPKLFYTKSWWYKIHQGVETPQRSIHWEVFTPLSFCHQNFLVNLFCCFFQMHQEVDFSVYSSLGSRLTDLKEHTTIFKENVILKMSIGYFNCLRTCDLCLKKIASPKDSNRLPGVLSPGSQLRIGITPRIFEKNSKSCLEVPIGNRRSIFKKKKRRQKFTWHCFFKLVPFTFIECRYLLARYTTLLFPILSLIAHLAIRQGSPPPPTIHRCPAYSLVSQLSILLYTTCISDNVGSNEIPVYKTFTY